MKNKWFLPLFALVIVLAACGNSANEENTSESNEEFSSNTYTVTDDRGVEVAFEQIPETVISLQPSNTEILFALGVGDKVIGVTEYDKYPEEVNDIEKVSDSMTVNTERVVELNPDVVIAYTIGGEEQVEQLEAAGLNVFVIQSASSVEDVYGDILQIAKVMGVEDKGKELVENMKEKLSAIKEKTEGIENKKKVYFEIAPTPDIWSIGSGTFQQELIELAGVENIYADLQGWFSVSEEDVIHRNPEAIITTVNYTDNPTGEIMSRQGWETMTAIQKGAVYELNADILDRPGPRITEATELIAKAIYPELFEE
ncbi:MAG: ABC transporter substrate-binding protein [Lysinibacillus sp.]|nr:ABC transporter substrate-binding protein [Lysinibacillus sp.]